MGTRLKKATALYLNDSRVGNAREAAAGHGQILPTPQSSLEKEAPAQFNEFLGGLRQQHPAQNAQIIRGFEDGLFVFLHVMESQDDGEFRYVTASLFEIDIDAKLTERRDVIEEIGATTESGHTRIDGPTEPDDLHKTEQNKHVVMNYIEDVLIPGNIDQLAHFVSTDTYIEHASAGLDGFEALDERLRRQHETASGVAYIKLHHVIGHGNFVASMSQVTRAGADIAAIDLFRVKNSRIVEHWEVSAPTDAKEKWEPHTRPSVTIG